MTPTVFRAGGQQRGLPDVAAAAPVTYLADVSEYQADVVDAAYLAWSKAIAIRALYGADHDDAAWYGGQRRALLHSGGARVVLIYQYLVAGQSAAAQAQAFHQLVGAIQPGEVFVADFEEGAKQVLTDWFNEMLALYGSEIHPYLWVYTGFNFGQEQGALPVEWIAEYGSAEPSTPHKLWQFTSAYQVPGVGSCDASLFHGSIDELAALAFPQTAPKPTPQPASGGYGPPRNLTVRAGDSTVLVERCDPPAGASVPPDHYEISVYTGSYPSAATLVAKYPRYMRAAPEQFGGLQDIPSGEHMTLRAVAYGPDGAGQYADVHFEMP
jgi:GH25 family lysozyme M1 (1,4-beta-N-acetylmuramidase)